MKNYNVSDEPVTEVAVDINDIKDTCNEKKNVSFWLPEE